MVIIKVSNGEYEGAMVKYRFSLYKTIGRNTMCYVTLISLGDVFQ